METRNRPCGRNTVIFFFSIPRALVPTLNFMINYKISLGEIYFEKCLFNCLDKRATGSYFPHVVWQGTETIELKNIVSDIFYCYSYSLLDYGCNGDNARKRRSAEDDSGTKKHVIKTSN